jgi:hypothetical protein
MSQLIARKAAATVAAASHDRPEALAISTP